MLRLAVYISVCALIAVSAAPLSAAPTDPIGSATTVKNKVSAELQSDLRTLKLGDSVYQNELIEVGDDSVGELVLNDDTMLALGPGTKLLLDKFVYNGERARGDILVDIVKGTFRFITGVASKRSYRIRTPSASITVRGTIFDVYAADDGMIWLLLIEGGVRACNDRGDCHSLDKPGMVIRVTGDGNVEKPVRWSSLPGTGAIAFATAFPFIVNAPNIDPSPLLSQDDIVNAKPKKSKPKKKKAKKKTKKKKASKSKSKKKKKVYVKKRKKKRVKKASSGNSVIPLAVGIGIGIAIGKKKRRRHRRPKAPSHGNGLY